MKRSGLNRTSNLRRETQLMTVSAKRKAEAPLWARVKAEVLRRDRGECQARGIAPGPCQGPVDPHHVWPTGRGGPRLEANNIESLCRAHHDHVHSHPRWARDVGFLS